MQQFYCVWEFGGGNHGGNFGRKGTIVVTAKTQADAIREAKETVCEETLNLDARKYGKCLSVIVTKLVTEDK
ncbi:hypothetical protein COU16_02040 [Candidatus Kaiserbacteria bacterium CG10_big_fil_rev_8_21_14_0_10_47_16]|uniref:Uncharacterized protein n=1 Tax=Candidatus Kaiserbacteria bacterium CG10_big_fil_rev_8_21_14_0_10_47_16 TaxID=1974608 RepID=A0A2H0UD79_9BACT|nr:MAG: hypothetical protein COU16_02040 [Candidatus Kaiserbacteria bacterium CG10_big_fil_rev_8_21_14_0_10_47_16]